MDNGTFCLFLDKLQLKISLPFVFLVGEGGTSYTFCPDLKIWSSRIKLEVKYGVYQNTSILRM